MEHEKLEKTKQYRVLSGSTLKVIAVISMLIDHYAFVFLPDNTDVLFVAFGHSITLYEFMNGIGRLAFPIFAFLIVEGYLHTHDRKRYGISLALFALLSEIPWDLLHGNSFFIISTQNVFFTLFLGYLAICMLEKYREQPQYQAVWLISLLIVSIFLHADYGCSGYCFILFMYVMRKYELIRAVIGCGFLASRWKAGLAFIPIALYNGQRGFIRGKVAKYCFYLIYPIHILILYLLKNGLI